MVRKGQISNPFVFSRALSPSEAIERPHEVQALLDKVTGGHAVTLYAPRRMGKTSLLKQLQLRAE
jgi:predicted AAA+ superfamily ATPase